MKAFSKPLRRNNRESRNMCCCLKTGVYKTLAEKRTGDSRNSALNYVQRLNLVGRGGVGFLARALLRVGVQPLHVLLYETHPYQRLLGVRNDPDCSVGRTTATTRN